MTAKNGIVQEIRKISWCVSIKIKVNTAIYIVKLARTNYNIKPGDGIHWFEEKPHIFYWTPKGSEFKKATLYQWGHGPIKDDY
jgi:hypothetical protein